MTSSRDMDRSPFEPLVRSIESASALDGPAGVTSRAARAAFSPGPFKDAISGTWLGHALHPLLTDVVIGSFISATALDLLAPKSSEVASRRLIALGISAYGPTALAGVSDWVDAAVDDRVKRVGIVHAWSNGAALMLYAASLRARRRGFRLRCRLLSGGGAAVLLAGGYLGGHLTLRRGIGADQTVFDPGPVEWTTTAAPSELGEGRPVRLVVDDTPLLVVRLGGTLHAIHDRCSHRGCSLSEGTVEGNEIVCSCHSSRFDLRDGSLLRGPATAPQPAFEVRSRDDGALEVRRAAGG